MNTPLKKLKVVVTKTADGRNDYIQILSEDQFGLNIVLISDVIELVDARGTR